jgi:hypothetical protein
MATFYRGNPVYKDDLIQLVAGNSTLKSVSLT